MSVNELLQLKAINPSFALVPNGNGNRMCSQLNVFSIVYASLALMTHVKGSWCLMLRAPCL
jgi:hypothetical protein